MAGRESDLLDCRQKKRINPEGCRRIIIGSKCMGPPRTFVKKDGVGVGLRQDAMD